MITSAIITVFIIFGSSIVWFLQLFGTATLPEGLVSAIASLSGYYSSLNTIFPVDTLLQILAFELTIELAIFTYRLVRWSYQKMPSIT